MHRLLAGKDVDVLSPNTKRNRCMIIGRSVMLKNDREELSIVTGRLPPPPGRNWPWNCEPPLAPDEGS
jgi:hypothetical protein